MNRDLLQKIISDYSQGKTGTAQIVALFERVRDIPYGSIGSREPTEVYTKQEGTCSGKHELLKALYNELGVQTKDFIAIHRFKDLRVEFPEDIQVILDRSDIVDPHNFFKINYYNRWLQIDLTWDLPLKKFGFPVTERWSGTQDMNLAVVATAIHETPDPIAYKNAEIAKLPEKVQADRKLFLEKLTKWVKILRKTT